MSHAFIIQSSEGILSERFIHIRSKEQFVMIAGKDFLVFNLLSSKSDMPNLSLTKSSAAKSLKLTLSLELKDFYSISFHQNFHYEILIIKTAQLFLNVFY